MNPALPVIGVVGLLALLMRKNEGDGAAAAEPDAGDVQKEVKRIVQESKEIVQGKRTSYSDAPNKKVTPRDAAERTKGVIDKVKTNTVNTSKGAEDALAVEAARLVAKQEASDAAKAYGQRQVDAAKPAPKPDKPVPVVPIRPAPIFVPQPAKPTPVAAAAKRPAGYDQAKAKNAAEGLAKHIKSRNYNYDRTVLTAWQKVAGIAQDGVYGPAAANALKYFTPVAPKKLFAKAKNGTPYPNTPYPPPEWS